MSRGDEPAYPVPTETDGEWLDPATCKQWKPWTGMTLREHYAGLAMQGLLACPDGQGFPSMAEAAKFYAERSVAYADALIAELEHVK